MGSPVIDLTGKRFNRFTVLEFSRASSHGSYWKCVCDCGKETVVRADHLKNGMVASCGCMSSRVKANDMTGKRFGMLVATNIHHIEKRQGAYWNCTCDCGGSTIARSSHLTDGKVASCGCIKESYIAFAVKKYFRENYSAIPEYKILRNPETGWFLPFDLFIPDKYFVEINGNQHYLPGSSFWLGDINRFMKSRKRGALKKRFAQENGIFIEIDTRKYKFADRAIEYIESIIKENE